MGGDERHLLIMYGTQTGNSRAIAQELGELATGRGWRARVLGMEKFKEVEFGAEDARLVVLISSSTGNGDAPDNADRFLRYVRRRTTPQIFERVSFTVAAMGDSNYEQFCEVGKQFDAAAERLGGKRILKRADVDEVEGMEEQVHTAQPHPDTATLVPGPHPTSHPNPPPAQVEAWYGRLWPALDKAHVDLNAAPSEDSPDESPSAAAASANEPPGAAGVKKAGEAVDAEAAKNSSFDDKIAAELAKALGQPAPNPPSKSLNEPDGDPAGSTAETSILAPIRAARWLTPAPPANYFGSDEEFAAAEGGAVAAAEKRYVLHVELDLRGKEFEWCAAATTTASTTTTTAPPPPTTVGASLPHLAAGFNPAHSAGARVSSRATRSQ